VLGGNTQQIGMRTHTPTSFIVLMARLASPWCRGLMHTVAVVAIPRDVGKRHWAVLAAFRPRNCASRITCPEQPDNQRARYPLMYSRECDHKVFDNATM
jgi:hypothetical protein